MPKNKGITGAKLITLFKNCKGKEIKKIFSTKEYKDIASCFFDVVVEGEEYLQFTLLDCAINFKNKEIVDFCLASKTYANEQGLITNLDTISKLVFFCVRMNDTFFLEELIDNQFGTKIELFYRIQKGTFKDYSPFFALTSEHSVEFLKIFYQRNILTDFNAPIFQRDTAFVSAFQLAVTRFPLKSIIFMLSKGANPIASDDVLDAFDIAFIDEDGIERAKFLLTIIQNKFIKKKEDLILYLSKALAKHFATHKKFNEEIIKFLLEQGADLFLDLDFTEENKEPFSTAYASALCLANIKTIKYLMKNYGHSAQVKDSTHRAISQLIDKGNDSRIIFLDKLGINIHLDEIFAIEGLRAQALVYFIHFPNLVKKLIIDRNLTGYRSQIEPFKNFTPIMFSIFFDQKEVFNLLIPYIVPEVDFSDENAPEFLGLAFHAKEESKKYFITINKIYREYVLQHKVPLIKEKHQLQHDLSALIILDALTVFEDSKNPAWNLNLVEVAGPYKGFPIIALVIEFERKDFLACVKHQSIDWTQRFFHPMLQKTLTVLEFFKQSSLKQDTFFYDSFLATIDDSYQKEVLSKPFEEQTLKRIERTSSENSFGQLLQISLSNYSIFRNSHYLAIAKKSIEIIQKDILSNDSSLTNQEQLFKASGDVAYLLLRFFQALYYYFKSIKQHEYAQLMYKIRGILMWSNYLLPESGIFELMAIAEQFEFLFAKSKNQSMKLSLTSLNNNENFQGKLQIKEEFMLWEKKYQEFIFEKNSMDLNLYLKSFYLAVHIISDYLTPGKLVNNAKRIRKNAIYDSELAVISIGAVVRRFEKNYGISLDTFSSKVLTKEIIDSVNFFKNTRMSLGHRFNSDSMEVDEVDSTQFLLFLANHFQPIGHYFNLLLAELKTRNLLDEDNNVVSHLPGLN